MDNACVSNKQGRFRIGPLCKMAVIGAVFGAGVIHTTAAFFILADSGYNPATILALAFAPAEWGVLAYHMLLGMALGLVLGWFSQRMYRHQLEDKDREAGHERQLHQSQKMESVGRLAGGVAHDFNNLLTALSINLHLATQATSIDSPAHKYLGDAQRVADRAAHLPRQLLTFSRKTPGEAKPIDLNGVLEDIRKLLRRVISEDITIVTQTTLGAVAKIDPGQYEQVLMNLVVNARDAMPKGGQVRISTRLTDVPTGHELAAHVAPGRYVVTEVADTGTGIAPEHLPKLFEPFFTTKEVGKGTGLGLSICYAIAKQNAGHIVVRSAPGHGSTFGLYLPLADEKPAMIPAIQAPSPTVGTETVLLVEDDADIREAITGILTRRGYQVLVASDGVEGLSVATKHHPKRIDLVLTDVLMPNMDGHELLGKVRRVFPAVRAILMSGYAADRPQSDAGATVPFLAKPFTPEVLTAKIRETLEGAA